MTTTIFSRLSASAVLALAALLFMIPARSRAQIEHCNCPTLTVVVEKEVACRVTLGFKSPSGKTTIEFSPGSTTSLPCEDGTIVALLDCMRRASTVPANGCVININASPDFACCVDACLTQDARGCWMVVVRPTVSAAPSCPCQ